MAWGVSITEVDKHYKFGGLIFLREPVAKHLPAMPPAPPDPVLCVLTSSKVILMPAPECLHRVLPVDPFHVLLLSVTRGMGKHTAPAPLPLSLPLLLPSA